MLTTLASTVVTPASWATDPGEDPWPSAAVSTGAPTLTEALVNFDALIREVKEVGTHSVIFAEVQQVRAASATTLPVGLAYFNRRFHSLDGPAA